MLKKIFIFVVLFICCAISRLTSQGIYPAIIPQPVQLERLDGEFLLSGKTTIYVKPPSDEMLKIVHDFANRINNAKFVQMPIFKGAPETDEKDVIFFSLSDDKDKYGEEGYSIAVSPGKISVKSNHPHGLFYAVQTLYQLLPVEISSGESVGSLPLSVPCVNILDYPRFRWRGNMLDPSRHFISIDFIKRNLDYLASLKMNVFHWHLTDDQGWRIEIESLPNLTNTGAWRVDRNDEPWAYRQEQQPNEIATYGGFYTQDEIKEIVAYAADRYITVIPEIDMPGHSRAAIASYPEISCDGKKYLVATGGIMEENTYCPGKEETYEFVAKVLNEVMDLFPAPYVHIGGDECNKEKWKKCVNCQQTIMEHKLNGVEGLQSYFIQKVEQIVNAKGKNIIGWDEILEGGLAPHATLMSWRGIEGGIKAAKMRHEVVMTPGQFCYLDLKQGDPELEPEYGYSQLLLSTAYSYDPLDIDLTEEEKSRILGVQGNLWGESMQKPYDHNYMLFPRLFAIAEVGWTLPENKDFENFVFRVETAFKRLDAMKVNYAPSMYNVSVEQGEMENDSVLYIKLKTEVPHVDVYYTLNGKDPGTEDFKYNAPIAIFSSSLLKARSFISGLPVGRLTEKEINIHKAAGKKVIYHIPPSDQYSTSLFSLTDCIRGSLDFTRNHWVGFQGTDADIEIDLGRIEKIDAVNVSLLHKTGSWIFLPREIVCLLSMDGEDFLEVSSIDFSEETNKPGSGKYLAEFKFMKQPARFIRIKASGMHENPGWHMASGGKNWIFMDEIMVE